MRNVLSQAEIDNLLKSLEDGEVKTEDLIKEIPRVRKYDFRRPNRFSKSNLGTLSLIHDNMARQLANLLTAYLRIPVSAKLATVDQVAFEDLVVSLPGNTLVTVFTLNDNGLGLLNAGPDLAVPMIDLICGGSGAPMKKGRPITEIELVIYQRLSTYMLERYEAAWRDTIPISCKLQSVETNPRLIQSISPSEMVAVVTLTLTINKTQGILTVCLPFRTMDAIINRPNAEVAIGSGVNLQEQWRERQRLLGNTTLSLTAVLGDSEITVQDFLQLAVGDVLAINRKPGELAELLIEDRRAFAVQPGTFNNQLAVQIVSPVAEGDER